MGVRVHGPVTTCRGKANDFDGSEAAVLFRATVVVDDIRKVQMRSINCLALNGLV